MEVTWSVFDILGPVMVGPSSSHTAGGCRIGYMAQAIYGKFNKVDIYLHGSFAEVCEGHSTDVAVLGGAIQIPPHSKLLKDSFKIAKERGIEFTIEKKDLGPDLHPNTAKLVFDDDITRAITGFSIGGGKAVINKIGKIPINISLERSTMILNYDSGQVAPHALVNMVTESEKNVVNIRTGSYKNDHIIAIEVLEWFTKDDVVEFETIPGVSIAKYVNHVPNFVDLND